MTTKVLNYCQACWAELLTNYGFVLLHTSDTKNSADGPSRRLNYSENPLPQDALIPLQAFRFLPANTQATNVFFANLIGMHAVIVSSLIQDKIIASYPTDAVVQ